MQFRRPLFRLSFFPTPNSSVNQDAMHSDFIERNIPAALSPRARECFLHFPKLTRGSHGQNTIRECAMSESNMIFGASVICAFARRRRRWRWRWLRAFCRAARNHAAINVPLVLSHHVYLDVKKNVCECNAHVGNLRCNLREFTGVQRIMIMENTIMQMER